MGENSPQSCSFQRARTPQQRQQRQDMILAATRALLEKDGLSALTLNGIARKVGLAKSNVLRYFGSREAILLRITTEEYRLWLGEVEDALISIDEGGAQAIHEAASILAAITVKRPLLCPLLHDLSATFEHNVTVEEIIEFKRDILLLLNRLADALERVCGPFSEAGRKMIIPLIHAAMTQTWEGAHPAPALVAAAQQEPSIPLRQGQQEHYLRLALTIILGGLRRRD
ncbi:MAG: TetR family transcriptional regulator [Actinomycetaceae bacterium]|nr:TetR family transcriptional regulator [Actinomycetaceae bacterium]